MSKEEKPLDLAAIEERQLTLYQPAQSFFPTSPTKDAVFDNAAKDIAALIVEVKRLRGVDLKEYHWNTESGYCGGIDLTIVAGSLEKALEYAREYLDDYEFKEITQETPDISEVSPKLSGYYVYHMNPGG